MFVACGVDSSRGVEIAEGMLIMGERICRVTVESQTASCGRVVDNGYYENVVRCLRKAAGACRCWVGSWYCVRGCERSRPVVGIYRDSQTITRKP